MKSNYISKVIKYFLKENYSAETNEKVQQWLIEDDHQEEKDHALYEFWEENAFVNVNNKTMEALNKTKANIGLNKGWKNQRTMQLNPLKIASVITLLLLLTGGIYYFYANSDHSVNYITMEGEIRTVNLPDGSIVWLNSGSSISYKYCSKNKIRLANLSGEAFFIIKTDSLHPFIVKTAAIKTEVLGTEFNIEDYPDNSKTIVTLSSGKIKINLSEIHDKNDFYILEPDQQFIYSPSFGASIQPVRAKEIESWKNGNLIFNDVPLKDIVRKLERHFNLKIIIHNIDDYNGNNYVVKFVNEENIEQIMDILQITVGEFTYEIIK